MARMDAAGDRSPLGAGLPAPAAAGIVVAGLVVQEVGAAMAVWLFPQAGPIGTVMLRLIFGAAVLWVVARPRLRGHTARAWRAVGLLALALAVMNASYYLALARLPLGVTVTIEVLGPLALSVATARRRAAWLWAALALTGVVLLAGGGWERLDPIGVAFALGAAAMWALYIVSSARVGREFSQLDGLALAMAIGAVVMVPFGVLDAGSALLRPEVLALALAVAVLSSALPYALELIALRSLTASAFGVLMALAPATATLAGFVLLGQHMSIVELAGIVLVVAASIGAVRSTRRPPDVAPPPA